MNFLASLTILLLGLITGMLFGSIIVGLEAKLKSGRKLWIACFASISTIILILILLISGQ